MFKRITTNLLLFLCLVFFIKSNIVLAQNDPSANTAPIHIEANYTGDNVNNLEGGIKTGSCYLGLANFRVHFDPEKAGLWKGGQLYLNVANTHGSSPSEEFLGDMQVASNIEAGNHTFFQEFWIKQSFNKLELTAGLQDLNVEFANTQHGGIYLNSSFGILPTISSNIPAPVYPLTALGISAKWTPSERITTLAAIYDGSPTDFDQNPYNLKWKFKSNDGFLAIMELQIKSTIANLPSTFKVGAYSHNHLLDNDVPDSLNVNNYGFYTIVDQMLWKKNKGGGLASFLQLGFSPARYNNNYFYFGTGLNYSMVFSKRGTDVLGIALAVAGLKNNARNEKTIELSYKTQITRNIYLQPDLQYIIDPAGMGALLDNCLGGTLRFGILL